MTDRVDNQMVPRLDWEPLMNSVVTRQYRIPPDHIDETSEGGPRLKFKQRDDSGGEVELVSNLRVKKDRLGNFWCDIPHVKTASRLGFAIRNPVLAVKGHKTGVELRNARHKIECRNLAVALFGASGLLVTAALAQISPLRKWGRCHGMGEPMKGDCYTDAGVALATLAVAAGAAAGTFFAGVWAWQDKIFEEAEKDLGAPDPRAAGVQPQQEPVTQPARRRMPDEPADEEHGAPETRLQMEPTASGSSFARIMTQGQEDDELMRYLAGTGPMPRSQPSFAIEQD